MWRIEFFEILAQIGPVLLVAYVLEARLKITGSPVSPGARRRLRMRLYGLFSALLAQGLALTVVAGALPHSRAWGLITAGALLTSLTNLTAALGGADETPYWTTWSEWLITVAAGAVFGFGLFDLTGVI